MPRFSIIITCYNQRSFIGEAVNSALAQEYSDKQIIVVDDGSTDDSPALLAEYADRINACFLAVNQGAYAARNKGASLANGDYILFLDGDDLLLPWALTAYSKIIDLKTPKIIIPRLLWFDSMFTKDKTPEVPNELELVEYEALFKKDRHVRFSHAVMDRECFNRCGKWAADLFHLDDHDLLLRLGYAGKVVQILCPFIVAYRMHGSNSINQLDRMLEGILKIIQREKANMYPGGRACRFERYAVIGGMAFYWLRQALQSGFYAEARKLLATGWAMISIAVFHKGVNLALERRPKEIVPFV